MSDDAWQEYREALQTAARVDGLQRQALGRAVHQREQFVDQARVAQAQQQTMMDRARTEARELDGRLAELQRGLGRVAQTGPVSEPAERHTLQQVRLLLAEIRSWTDEAVDRQASLARTLNRLRAAEPDPPPPSPEQPVSAGRKGCALTAAAMVALCLAVLASLALLS